ncbi:MAG: hypothetical protein KDI68_14875 [Gammaproteobacteria bacterium]|nr:hypothetical protein [Gammaproteobacteria bacterium]
MIDVAFFLSPWLDCHRWPSQITHSSQHPFPVTAVTTSPHRSSAHFSDQRTDLDTVCQEA